jgi:soluble lytic murein transglycosylase-like protein
VAGDYDALIQEAAARYGLDASLFRRMLVAESNLRPDIINPKSGAAGIAQFMPGTAAHFKINPLDPTQAIPASAQYLRQNLDRFGGDYDTALAAYNWGPGNVSRYGTSNMPVETQNYVVRIRGADVNPLLLTHNGGASRPGAAPVQDIPRPAVADVTLPALPEIAMPTGPRMPMPGNDLAGLFFRAAQSIQPQEV